jgi:hypothetical protein
MFHKLNFTFKDNEKNSKKTVLLNELKRKYIKNKEDKTSLKSTFDLKNKVDDEVKHELNETFHSVNIKKSDNTTLIETVRDNMMEINHFQTPTHIGIVTLKQNVEELEEMEEMKTHRLSLTEKTHFQTQRQIGMVTLKENIEELEELKKPLTLMETNHFQTKSSNSSFSLGNIMSKDYHMEETNIVDITNIFNNKTTKNKNMGQLNVKKTDEVLNEEMDEEMNKEIKKSETNIVDMSKNIKNANKKTKILDFRNDEKAAYENMLKMKITNSNTVDMNMNKTTNGIMTMLLSLDKNETIHGKIMSTQPIPILNINQTNTVNIIHKLKSENIKTLNNVYQSKYKDNIQGTGLGDFLRGSYFLIEYCLKYGFNYRIIFNNKIEELLMHKPNIKIPESVSQEIQFFGDTNILLSTLSSDNYVIEPEKNPNIINIFTEYLKKSIINKKEKFICCTSQPVNKITQESKIVMQKILEPTNEMKLKINNVLNYLELKPKQYMSIHVRSGDNYLKNESNSAFKKKYLVNLIESINQIYKNSETCNVLLICDNNNVKSILVKNYPRIKSMFKEIVHLAESNVKEDKIKNTLIDFYLLSLSKSIHSFSCYQHGSGFSNWCAQTYNIPYSCKYIAI